MQRSEPLVDTDVKKSGFRDWSWRLLAAVAGLGLLAGLVWWTSPGQIVHKIREIGVGLVVLVLLGGLSHLVKTLAWRYSLSARHRALPLSRLFLVRLAGEAVSQVTVGGHLLGESTRAWMMRSAVPTAGSISAVIADRAMFSLTSMLVTMLGLVLWVLTPVPGMDAGPGSLLVVPVLLAPVVLWILALRHRWPVLSQPLHRMARVWPRLRPRLPVVRQVEENLYGLYHDDRRNFARIFILQLVGQGFSLLEVYLVLVFLGIDADIILTLKIEGAVKCVNLLGAVIPGNLGTSEAGNMLLLAGLGLGSANGLALALARRMRGWFWTLIGLVILYVRTFVFDPVPVTATLNHSSGSETFKGRGS